MNKKKLEKIYEDLEEYLIKYYREKGEYKKYLSDLYGVSPFLKETKHFLVDNALEERYEFFGKILININTLENFKPISNFVSNENAFISITTEEEFEKFKEKIESEKKDENFSNSNLIKKLNEKAKDLLKIEEDIWHEEEIEDLAKAFNKDISIKIIENLEEKLRPYFSKRDESLKGDYKSTASLLEKISGISKDKKSKLKEGGISKWNTNYEAIGLKI